MTSFEDQLPWINTYYVDGIEAYQEDGFSVPLAIGDGFIDSHQQGRRFRVVDVWLSTDKHGRFDVGRHVFLKDVSGSSDDLPAHLAPGYFTE